jgi:hypothetical protein
MAPRLTIPSIRGGTISGITSLSFVAGAPISWNSGQVTVSEASGALNFSTSAANVGAFSFVRSVPHTSTTADLGDLLYATGDYNGNLSVQSTQGYGFRLVQNVGTTTTSRGSIVSHGPIVSVKDAANPTVSGFSEYALMTGLVEAWPTGTNYGVAYWGLDITVRGASDSNSANRDGYLTGGNVIVTKYTPGTTIDATHFGSNIFAFCTTPPGGAATQSLEGSQTAYTMNDGVVINGFAGPQTATDGQHANATSAFTYALRIGGQGGASWMNTLNSKYGTGLYVKDFLTYGINVSTRHPDATGQAMYVESGAGNVGIHVAPNANPVRIGQATNATAATATTYAQMIAFSNGDPGLAFGIDGTNALLQSWSGAPLVLNGQGNPIVMGSPVRLPSYVVASLPAAAAGDTAFASNGRKSGEGAGAGTGVQVYYDGTAWRACDTSNTVAA